MKLVEMLENRKEVLKVPEVAKILGISKTTGLQNSGSWHDSAFFVCNVPLGFAQQNLRNG